MNLLAFSEFAMNPISILRIKYKFTMVFANSLSIHDLPRELAFYFRNTMNLLSLPRIHSELTIFKTKFTINSRSFSWINFEFAIFFANAFLIHFLFREFTLLTSHLMRIDYEFTFVFRIHFEFAIFRYENLLWIRNSLSISKIL